MRLSAQVNFQEMTSKCNEYEDAILTILNPSEETNVGKLNLKKKRVFKEKDRSNRDWWSPLLRRLSLQSGYNNSVNSVMLTLQSAVALGKEAYTR